MQGSLGREGPAVLPAPELMKLRFRDNGAEAGAGSAVRCRYTGACSGAGYRIRVTHLNVGGQTFGLGRGHLDRWLLCLIRLLELLGAEQENRSVDMIYDFRCRCTQLKKKKMCNYAGVLV